MVALTCAVLGLAWDARPRRPGPPVGTKAGCGRAGSRRRPGRPGWPPHPTTPLRNLAIDHCGGQLDRSVIAQRSGAPGPYDNPTGPWTPARLARSGTAGEHKPGPAKTAQGTPLRWARLIVLGGSH